jgi:transcription termination factor NusB
VAVEDKLSISKCVKIFRKYYDEKREKYVNKLYKL